MKRCAKTWIVLSVIALTAWTFASVNPAYAAAKPSFDAAALISEAEGNAANHDRRLQIQAELHRHLQALSSSQRWHLRLLDAREDTLEGLPTKARIALEDIIEHSGDHTLRVRASSVLLNIYTVNHEYLKAFTLVNQLTQELPDIKDNATLVGVLAKSSEVLAWAGQTDLALGYAKQLEAALRPGDKCFAYWYEINALKVGHRLAPDAVLFKTATDSCLANKHAIFADGVRSTQASLLLQNGQPRQALAVLRSIAPSVRKSGYKSSISWLNKRLATAYLTLGDLPKAKQSALAALNSEQHGDDILLLRDTYKVLYQIEKKVGNDAAALTWHEKYLAKDQAAMDDTKARALAYQMVRQDVVAKKLKLDTLSNQNKILQLHETLAAKSVETSRLYIALLLLAIGFIIVGMFRLRRSQLRFRQLARHDGLTGASNRQHFLDQAQRTLERLKRIGADASLVLLDLDHFKQVNDDHGHAAGDAALSRTVDICRQALRTSDLFGRLGGEEFGILMPGVSCAQSIEIITRMRRTLASTTIALDAGATIRVSASFGLACSATSGYGLQQLLRVADAALYRAKNSGRNQLVVGSKHSANNAPRVVDAAHA